MKKVEDLLRIGLQFFADENNNDNGKDEGNQSDEDQNSNSGSDDAGKKDEPKSYTNEELKKMMAKEKKQGKSAGRSELLKELGIEDADEFKKNLEAFNKFQEEQKSEAEKANDKINKVTNEKTEAEKRAQLAEAKVEAMKNGVNPEFVDDVIVIALSKQKDGEELSDIIEGMKETHKMFFETKQKDDGTGNNINGKKTPLKNEGLGAELGKAKAESIAKKSSYFRN